MSKENNSDEIPVEVISDEKIKTNNSEDESKHTDNLEQISDDPIKLLELEKQKVSQYEEKLKHVLADFQNLSRKTQSDIENGVNSKINEFMLDFIKIYDDFIRAKEVISESKINADGLNSILKNMESLMQKYNVTPIEALGEIFDPNYHEAISIISDSTLDDNTITKEIRKGYISHERIIRPTLVEISKKEDNDKND
ncbi:nucleotide exchange factor GrpE [Nitrosopumilus sp.]|nr:nucleotide exchange factor GrpE [Nitrosopumilus sp.]MDB4857134.1 nucleotide exchange factor GrpE [Nitrosopumilus sp.]